MAQGKMETKQDKYQISTKLESPPNSQSSLESTLLVITEKIFLCLPLIISKYSNFPALIDLG